MRRVLLAMIFLLFLQNLQATDMLPVKDSEGLDLIGINGLGPNVFLKVRKDFFESYLTNIVNDEVGTIMLVEEFNFNMLNNSISVDNLNLNIEIDYVHIDRFKSRNGDEYNIIGDGYTLGFGFHVNSLSASVNSSGEFFDSVPAEDLLEYIEKYLKQFGSIDIEGKINTRFFDDEFLNSNVFSMDSMETETLTINGWQFNQEGLLVAAGFDDIEQVDENIHLFAKIGNMLTQEIFSIVNGNEKINDYLDVYEIDWCQGKENICQIEDYEELCIKDGPFYSLFQDGIFMGDDRCLEYISSCNMLDEKCFYPSPDKIKHAITERSGLKYYGNQDAIYIFSDLYYPAKVYKGKNINLYEWDADLGGYTGNSLWYTQDNKSWGFFMSGDFEYGYSEFNPALLNKEKLDKIDKGVIEINVSEAFMKFAVERVMEDYAFGLIKEMLLEEYSDLDFDVSLEGVDFIIKKHQWIDSVTGFTKIGNVGKLSLNLRGNYSKATFSGPLVVWFIPKVGDCEGSINDSCVGVEILDVQFNASIDVPWYLKAIAGFAGSAVSNLVLSLVLPSATTLGGTVAISAGTSFAISKILDKLKELVRELAGTLIQGELGSYLDENGNFDLSEILSEQLKPVFGTRSYSCDAYFRNNINGNEKDSGIVFSIGFKNAPNYPLADGVKQYLTNWYWDDDQDGVLDVMDNCRDVYNPYQSDEDGDGIGNMCDGGARNGIIWIPIRGGSLSSPIHDTDYDGIANISDNCPNVKNKFIEAQKNDELISGVCVGDFTTNIYGVSSCSNPLEGGAVYNALTNKFLFTETGKCFDGEIHYWQPDHDLDGIGDACDHENGVAVLGSDVGLLAGYFSLYMESKLIDVQDGSKICFGFQNSTCTVPVIKNKYADITVRMNTMPEDSNSPNSTEENLTQKYCWVDTSMIKFWGDDGFCTTTEGNGMRVILAEMKYLPVYGYSHGSDPKPINDEYKENWKDPDWKNVGEEMRKCTGNCVFTWDWRKDLESEYYDLYDDYVVPVDEDKEDGENVNFITYVFSSGVQSGEDQKYMLGTGADKQINPLHFKNNRIYARSKRDTFGGTDISYYRGMEIDQSPFYFGWFDINDFLERYGISPWWWMTGPGMPFEYDNIDIYRYADGGISLIEKNTTATNIAGTIESIYVGKENLTGIFSLNANSNQKVLMTARDSDTAWSVGTIIEMPSYAGTVHKMVELIPGQEFLMMDSSSVYKFNTMAGAGDVNQQMFRVCSLNIQAEDIGRLPFDGAMAEIIKLGNRVLIVNKNAGELELYELDMVQGMVVPLEYENGPSGRKHLNFEVINDTLYIAGGADIDGTRINPLSDVYKFSFENGWTTVSEDTGLNLMGAIIGEDNGMLKVYSRPFIRSNKINVAVINESTGDVEITAEEIEGGSIIKQDYCIDDDDDGINVFPAIENNGICQKVEENDYEYSSYTFLDYKLTVAGYDDYLFAGGLAGIRTFKIKENGKLKKKQFKTLGMINNIAVRDRILYATRGDKIFIFEIKENGKLEKISSIKTDSCRNLRVSGKYLYTGEEEKVNIYDISTPSIPVKVKKIKTAYNVKDLEITGGKLYIYQEEGWWFWKDYEITEYDVRDLNNIVKEGRFEIECNDSEMMYDENHVYLGCGNGQYRINKSDTGLNPEQVNGEKKYFRDSYVRNGIIYTVHSGRIFLSR